MKTVSCFFVFVMSINMLFFSCNGQPKKISNNLQSDSFKKDIPVYYTKPFFKEYYRKLDSALGINSIENGFNGILIRLWRSYTYNDTGRLVILTFKDSIWDAELVTFNYLFSMNYPIDKKAIKKRPRLGWNKFIDSLNKLGLLTLPDESKIRNYQVPADADGITIEIANKNRYRIYGYSAPDLNERNIYEAKKIKEICRIIEKELDFEGFFQIKKSALY